MKYCSACSAEFKTGNFCTICGNKLITCKICEKKNADVLTKQKKNYIKNEIDDTDKKNKKDKIKQICIIILLIPILIPLAILTCPCEQCDD